MKLVIAEKPSVAQSIAKVIGAEKREDGYLEGMRLSAGNTLQSAEKSKSGLSGSALWERIFLRSN